MQFDEADNIVLDIIGKESPVLDGLPIQESSGSDAVVMMTGTDKPNENINNVVSESVHAQVEVTVSSDSNDSSLVKPSSSIQEKRDRVRKRPMSPIQESNDLLALKQTKIQAQIEGIQLENITRNLEILKFEKLIVLPPSNDTLTFLTEHYPSTVINVIHDSEMEL